MRCEHINQQNDWATAPPSFTAINWRDVLINAPMGPPVLKRVVIGCRSNGLPYDFGCWSEQKAWESETGLKHGLPKQSSCDTS